MVNRKLIRPTMAEVSATMSKFSVQGRKRVPPEQTHAENFYYVKQMNNKTPMVLRLSNGDEVTGAIEWYDKDCLKINREGAPNLLIYKSSILYMFKAEELSARGERDADAPLRRTRRSSQESSDY